jgi:DNA-binding response OmpR family regulator
LLDGSTLGDSAAAVTLELGGDDYVVKPLVAADLIMRINVVVRRRHRDPESSTGICDDGRLYIDFEGFLIRARGREVKLTLKEFSLLKYLVQHQDQVFPETSYLMCSGRVAAMIGEELSTSMFVGSE